MSVAGNEETWNEVALVSPEPSGGPSEDAHFKTEELTQLLPELAPTWNEVAVRSQAKEAFPAPA
jgi:hypothetical protein